MNYTIVPMGRSHLPALAQLEQLCFSEPWSETALGEELNNPLAHFLTAIDEDEAVVGYLGCHHVAGEGFIANIAVDPERRRQGIASALLHHAMKQADSLERLTLEVRASNHAAVALYRSAGFVYEGTRPRFYSHPTEDAYIYSYYPKGRNTV